MTANRKADIQRKLALAPVAKPPAGLADRIKREIPKQLAFDAERERRRFSQSMSFNLRVAASIVLMVSSVYLCVRILSDRLAENAAIERTERVLNSPEATARITSTAAAPAASGPAPPQATVTIAEAQPKPEARHLRATGAVAGGAAAHERDTFILPPPPPPPPPVVTEPSANVAAAPAEVASAAAPAPAPAPIPPPAPAAVAQRESAKVSDSAGFVRSANAADLAIGTPSTLFGMSLASPVQRFAAPAKPPSRVRVEADAAPAPFDSTKTLVRIAIDIPSAKLPPVGSDATLSIDFADEHVRAHRALTGEATANERVLVAGTSVTSLHEIELDPDAPRNATIATVRLSYKSVRDGKPQTITRTIRLRDLAKSWDAASKRMKAASLAASLTSAPKADVASKARAAGLDELAAAAEKP